MRNSTKDRALANIVDRAFAMSFHKTDSSDVEKANYFIPEPPPSQPPPSLIVNNVKTTREVFWPVLLIHYVLSVISFTFALLFLRDVPKKISIIQINMITQTIITTSVAAMYTIMKRFNL